MHWPDLLERYGPWEIVYERHRRWSADGTWKTILDDRQIEADVSDPDGTHAARCPGKKWAVNIDSTSCPTRQHAAGAARQPPADYPQRGRAREEADGREELGFWLRGTVQAPSETA